MERIIVKCSESWLIGALTQIGWWALGPPEISGCFNSPQTKLFYIEENVFLMEYLQRTHILRNQGSGWGTSPNETGCQAKPFQSGSRCVSACGMASHPRPACLSCGFRTFQPFSEQPSLTGAEWKAKQGCPTSWASVPSLSWRKASLDSPPVLSSLADTPRGPGLGWRERDRSQGCRPLWGRRGCGPKPRGFLTFCDFRPSRSLRSQLLLIFSQDSKNLVTGKRHRGPKGLLRGVPERLCRLEDAEWKREPGGIAGRLEGPLSRRTCSSGEVPNSSSLRPRSLSGPDRHWSSMTYQCCWWTHCQDRADRTPKDWWWRREEEKEEGRRERDRHREARYW